jgi:hypothetical protein
LVGVLAVDADTGDEAVATGGGTCGCCGLGMDAEPPTAAPTRAGAPTGNIVWQLGQRTILPVASSGTWSRVEHFGQLITCGITSSDFRLQI